MVEYFSHGVPLESYQLTKADHRGQAELERMMGWIRVQLEKAPPISEAGWRRLQELLGAPVPAHRWMRWRVRLFCGHITDVRHLVENQSPFDGRREHGKCSACDDRDQLIVAYEPIGPLASSLE